MALRFPPEGKVSYRTFPEWDAARANRFKVLFGILKEFEDDYKPSRDLDRQLKYDVGGRCVVEGGVGRRLRGS